MNKLEYRKYLRSTHWQNVKNRYYRTHEYICVRCGWRRGLQLHHLHYRNVGREKMEDLIYLCRKCHMNEHGIGVVMREGKELKYMWFVALITLLAFLWVYVVYIKGDY